VRSNRTQSQGRAPVARHAHNVEIGGSIPSPAITGFCHVDGIPFSLTGGYMHPNEMKITEDNVAVLMAEAEKLGSNHVVALQEQFERQTQK
jgi:hypothetical protein